MIYPLDKGVYRTQGAYSVIHVSLTTPHFNQFKTTKDITAFPHSCNILDGVKDDVRTPDKLVDGVNDTFDGRHMWLAPVFPGQVQINKFIGIVERKCKKNN